VPKGIMKGYNGGISR